MPKSFNFDKRILCSTVLKAFFQTKKTTALDFIAENVIHPSVHGPKDSHDSGEYKTKTQLIFTNSVLLL